MGDLMERIPYGEHGFIRPGDVIIVSGRNGERQLKHWWINRNTPRGEDADLYEIKPFGGQKLIEWPQIAAILRPRAALASGGDHGR